MNTTYFLNLIAGNVFRSKLSPALPTAYYIGLSTTTPQIDGTGDTEPASNTGYARVPLTGLTDPENGTVYNNEPISFDEATGSWGTVTHYVVYDEPTGGNLLFFGNLSTKRTIEANSSVIFKNKALAIDVLNTNT